MQFRMLYKKDTSMSENIEKWKQEIALENEKIALDRTKAGWEFWRTIAVSGAATIVVAIVSAFGMIYVGYLNSRSARELELIKIDSNLISSFGEQFLSEDLGTRIRAAHLFKSIAPSDDIRDRWSGYHRELADFNEAIIKAGGDPSQSIRNLMDDENFLKDWGGMGCRMDSLDGCIANMPQPGIEKFRSIDGQSGNELPG